MNISGKHQVLNKFKVEFAHLFNNKKLALRVKVSSLQMGQNEGDGGRDSKVGDSKG